MSGQSQMVGTFSRESGSREMPHAQEDALEKVSKRYEEMLTIGDEELRKITHNFIETLKEGLSHEGNTVPMLPAFVFGWPTGNEEGSYLSLDLGGTNLRVCKIDLKGDRKFELTQTKFRLTDEQKKIEGEELFDFCAQCCKEFVDSHCMKDIGDKKLPLGFTFSYPMV